MPKFRIKVLFDRDERSGIKTLAIIAIAETVSEAIRIAEREAGRIYPLYTITVEPVKSKTTAAVNASSFRKNSRK